MSDIGASDCSNKCLFTFLECRVVANTKRQSPTAYIRMHKTVRRQTRAPGRGEKRELQG